MNEILRRIGEIGLVPVIKLESASKALGLGRALVAGGLPVAEVTFRTGAAAEAIRAMREGLPELLVGAGTIVTTAQAKAALEAGASFLVCPAWDEAVVDFALERGIAILPGVSGPDGVARGAARGLEVLKFFPAEVSGGLPMLDALSGPFGGMKFVPTGGIDAANLGAYARKPQVLAVGGSWMVKAELIEAENWAGISALCREAVSALHGFSLAHLGINHPDEAAGRAEAARFAELFGFGLRETSASLFASESFELMLSPFLGEKGHLAIRCNDVERALARFRAMGIESLPETQKMEKGRIRAVYLKLELGGFAVHLLRA